VAIRTASGLSRSTGIWDRSRRYRRRAALLLTALATVGSIAGYAVLSVTVNGLPPVRVFPGWVAVLEPVSEQGEQVRLQVLSDLAGSRPLVGYTVVACGSRPYTADLLIGGAAQLTRIGRIPAQYAADLPAVQVERLPDLLLSYGQLLNYGPVQLVRVMIPAVPCVPGSTVQSATEWDGAAEGIAGYVAAPLEQSWRGPWGWWHGPHAVQAWPLTGALPGTDGAYGTFTGVAGIHGQWVRPDAGIQISTTGISLDQSIDSAIPEPSDPAVTAWSGTDAMNPVARLTDPSSVALLQDWTVVCVIALGIGSALLASLLFEWLRHRPEQAWNGRAGSERAHQDGLVPADHPGSPVNAVQQPGHRSPLITIAVLILAWVVSRGAQRRDERSGFRGTACSSVTTPRRPHDTA
jgi:hypothetical protein